MLAGARRALAAMPERADRIELVEGEAERLPFGDGEFDHLTFTYLLRYVDDPAATLAELARAVRPGGRIASLEFGVPDPPLWRPLWRLYTRAVLPAPGGCSGATGTRWAASSGRASRPSIASCRSARQLELWAAAGISRVRQRR